MKDQKSGIPGAERGRKLNLFRYFILIILVFSSTTIVMGAVEKSTILTAERISEPIVIDGYGNESAWSGASVLTTLLHDGSIGKVDVDLKALYDKDYIYFFVSWPDPTESVDKKLWTHNGSGWMRSGDEDRFAIFWNINDSISGFNIGGCAMLCHGDRMLTNAPDERADSWHWKAARTNPLGYVDDKYVSDIAVEYKLGPIGTLTEVTGRQADAKERGGNFENILEDESGPKYYEPNPTDKEDGRFIFKTEVVGGQAVEITDETVFRNEDTVPGYVLEKPVGSRGDIEAKGVWENGKWNVEFKRSLNTGHDDDVQFETTRTYRFGIAVMDNTGGFEGFGKGHSFDLGARTLEFGGKGSNEVTELVLVRDYLVTAKAHVNRDERGLALSTVRDALVVFNRIRDTVADVDPELFILIRNSFVESRRNPSLENVDILIENVDLAILTLQGKREPAEASLWLKILVLWGKFGIFAFVALSILAIYPIYRMLKIIKKPQFRNLGLFMLIIISPILLEGVGRLSALLKIPLLQNFSFTTSESVTIFWVAGMYIALYLGRIGFNEIDNLLKSLGRSKEELETRVEERTFELSNANKELENEIAEREQAELSLRESEEKFRTLAEKSPNMIFINKMGKVVYANEKCEEIMRYTREEYYSPDFDFLTLIAPEHTGLILKNFVRHQKGEEVEPYECTLITRNGERIDVIQTSKLIKYGGDIAILGIITDITEHKRAQEAMKRRLMKYKLDEGTLYMVQEPTPLLSNEVLKDLLKAGYNGFIISRMSEDKFKIDFDDKVEFLLISEKGGEKAIQPDLKEIEDRLEALTRGSAILIDRLDYLVFKNGFKKTLAFVQHLKEIAYFMGHFVILSVDPSTFTKRELGLLEKETEEVAPMQKGKLPEELLEILRFIFQQNSIGVKPSYTDVRKELRISKPTVRKRIKQLVFAGYLIEVTKGRFKVLELTEKSRNLFFE
jgi:PAS domain S-box-containing protein